MTIQIRKLLRLLPSVLIAALLALTVSYYWLGRTVEHHFKRLAAEMATPASGIRLQVVEYQRGLFSSRAVTKLSLSPTRPGNDRPLLRLEIDHLISHGPFPFSRTAGRSRPAPLLAVIHSRSIAAPNNWFNPAINAETRITPGGRAETFLRAFPGPETRESAGPNQPLAWRELSAHLLYPADLRAMQGELTLRDFGLEIRGHRLEIGALSTIFHYRLQEDGNGGETLSAGQRLAAGNLRAYGSGYGSLTAELAWRNLDRQALTALFSLVPWLTEVVLEQKPWEIPPPAAQVLVEALPRLLGRSPALEINGVKLGTPDGEATGRLRLAYQGGEHDRLFHPVMLLSGLDLELEASAPPSLPGRILPGRIPEPLRSGNEQAGGDDGGRQLSLQVSYREGELRVNGRAAPIQTLFSLFR